MITTMILSALAGNLGATPAEALETGLAWYGVSTTALNATVAPELALTAAPALSPLYGDADSPWYFQLGGALTTTENSGGPGEEVDFDEGYALSAAFGRRYAGADNSVGFDLELEGFYSDQDANDKGLLMAVNDVTAAGVMVNGLGDWALGETVSIYGGAGIGLAWLDIGTASDGLNDFNDEDGPFLAWQARAGLRFRVAPAMSMNVGYRLLNIDDAQVDDGFSNSSFDLETQQHMLEIGIRFGPSGT